MVEVMWSLFLLIYVAGSHFARPKYFKDGLSCLDTGEEP